MNGRQVEDIESHRRDTGEPPFAIAQCSMRSWLRCARSRKQFVPGRISRSFAIDNHAQFFVGPAGKVTQRILLNEAADFFFEHNFARPLVFFAQHPGPRQEPGSVWARGAIRGLFEQRSANEAFHGNVLARRNPLHQVTPPASKPVDPSLYGVLVDAQLRHAELSTPTIVAKLGHRRYLPFLVTGVAIQDPAGKFVVSIGEDVRLDNDLFSQHPFDGKAAGIDLGTNRFHHYAITTVRRQFSRWSH